MKYLEKILKSLLKCRSTEKSGGVIRGFYLEKYEKERFSASITACDSYVLVSYYLDKDEFEWFSRFLLPKYHNNESSVYFDTPAEAESSKGPYPNYRNAIPKRRFPYPRPLYRLDPVDEKRIEEFIQAATQSTSKSRDNRTRFIPVLFSESTNSLNGYLRHGIGQAGKNFIVVIQPIVIDEQSEKEAFKNLDYHHLVKVEKQ